MRGVGGKMCLNWLLLGVFSVVGISNSILDIINLCKVLFDALIPNFENITQLLSLF